jgi:hypothetical protein
MEKHIIAILLDTLLPSGWDYSYTLKKEDTTVIGITLFVSVDIEGTTFSASRVFPFKTNDEIKTFLEFVADLARGPDLDWTE